ncbi:hypothetical protein BASA81_003751 [Batrachochytrium salamandrivorans]|nr:hypothetical protein BASA81_003751 [Batrachochytrium salamandrivorans]
MHSPLPGWGRKSSPFSSMEESDVDRPRRRTLSNGLLYFSRQSSVGSVDGDDPTARLSPQARELNLWLQNKSQCDCVVQALLRGGFCDEAFQLRFAGFVNEYEHAANPSEALKKQMGKKIFDMFLAPSSQFKLCGIDQLLEDVKPKSGKDLSRLKDLLLGQIADSPLVMQQVRLVLGELNE